jgi:hypothetical protein
MKTIACFPGMLCATLLAIFTVSFISCEKSGYLPDKAGSATGKLLFTTITGIINDESGNPVPGVMVKAGSSQSVTNVYGAYLLENIQVNNKRFVVTTSKPGYFESVKAVAFIKESKCHYVHLFMMQRNLTGTFSAQAGGSIQVNGSATILFPANAIADLNGNAYTGTVKVYSAFINPDHPDFYRIMPGGDLRAETANGNDRVLTSFGMIKTEMFGQNGQPLNLAAGKKALLRFPVATSQLSQAPGTMPLWYLDEETALWQEEGTAILNGGFYEGDVAHFTWWNCDFPNLLCNITGQVVDCQGNPVPNVTIFFNNQYTLTTNSNGTYQATWPVSVSLTAQVLVSMNPGQVNNSNVINAGPFAAGTTTTLPDLVVPCGTSRLTGQVKGCVGNTVPSLVVITGSQNPQSYYCPDGIFDVQVIPSVPLNIVAYANNYSVSASVLSAPGGGTAELGVLNTCLQVNTHFIINGDGYINQLFEIDTVNTNTMYSPTGPTTGIIISGYTQPGNKQCLVQIDFCGSEKGNYELGPGNCNSDVSMILDGVAYYPDDANSSNDFITVVQYGPTGGKIRGSFFTHLQKADTTNGVIPITISGNFIVPRRH